MTDLTEDKLKAQLTILKTDLAREWEETQKRRIDPFRPQLQFLVGLVTFALAVLVGVFTALPKESEKLAAGAAAMLGGVLAWMALATLTATLAAFFLQLAKGIHYRIERQSGIFPVNIWVASLVWVLCLVPVIPGLMAVTY